MTGAIFYVNDHEATTVGCRWTCREQRAGHGRSQTRSTGRDGELWLIVGNDIRPRAEQTLAISYVVDGTRCYSTLYVLYECRIAN